MAYLFGLALLILFFIVLHYFTQIVLMQKIYITVIFAFLVAGAYWYNLRSEERRVHLQKVLLEFRNNNTIVCNGISVNSSDFSYSSGTQTFLAKKESKMYGQIISLDSCK